jgi:hypothetical protein
MRIVTAVHSSEAIRKILECLGLPSRAPPVCQARPDGRIDEEAFYERVRMALASERPECAIITV